MLAVNSDNGEILWQSKVASDNLYGIGNHFKDLRFYFTILVVHEDNIDPRCVSSSLHIMDEEVKFPKYRFY